MHYGIKGQKWGVRRYQNPDGTYTEEGLKRRYLRSLQNPQGILTKKGREHFYTYMGNYDKDINVPKDTKLFRVSASESENDNRRKYITIDAADNTWQKHYENHYKESFQHTYDAVKDIKLQSLADSYILVDEMLRNPDFQKKLEKQCQQKEEQLELKLEDYGYKTPHDKFFVTFMTDGDATKEFTALTIKRGYDGIVDAFGVKSNSPSAAIIFDPSNTIKETDVKKLH